MQSQKTIKIRRKFPDTHYFVYKDKQYPFKFNFFKLSSNYFITNEDELFQRKNIPLVEEEVGNYLNLDEETIHQFINYVQQQEIQLNNDNVISLHFLSEQFQIDDLATDTKEYIESHQQELALKILLFCQKNSLFKSEIYEEIISQNLLFYLKNSEMLELSVPKIYRIIDTSNQKSQEVNNFLLKCFEKFGKEASSLLAFCYLDKSNIDFFESIFYRFSNVLDFSFIDKTIFETVLVILKETKEKVKQKDEKIEDFQNTQKKLKETIKQKDEKIDELIKNQNNLKEKISQMKEEIDDLQNTQKNLKATIEQKEKKILKIQENEASKILKKDNIIELKQKEIDELKKKINQELKSKILTFDYTNEKNFDGIINYLTKKTGGNIHENGTIELTSTSPTFDTFPVYLLNQTQVYHFNPDDIIYYDFKDMKIEISSYTIKSMDKSVGHIRNWVFEISNDRNYWTEIDKHTDDPTMNSPGKIATFNVKKKQFARFVRFRHTGCFWKQLSPYIALSIRINSIEFYGRLEMS